MKKIIILINDLEILLFLELIVNHLFYYNFLL
jgi:hypothetical protein